MDASSDNILPMYLEFIFVFSQIVQKIVVLKIFILLLSLMNLYLFLILILVQVFREKKIII